MNRAGSLKVLFSAVVLLLILSVSACSPAVVSVATPTQSQSVQPPAQSLPTQTLAAQAGVDNAYPLTSGPAPIPVSTMYPNANDPDLKSLKTAVPPSDVPEPEPGKASLAGVVFSDTIMQVIPSTMFYLTPAIGKDKNEIPPAFVGPQPEKGDIVSKTDIKGQFSMNNIPPGSYILVVEAPLNWSVGQEGENIFKPLIIKLEAGQKQNLNIVYVSWP